MNPPAPRAAAPADNWPAIRSVRAKTPGLARAHEAYPWIEGLVEVRPGHALRGEDAADRRPRWPAVDSAAKTPPAEAACARRMPSSRYLAERHLASNVLPARLRGIYPFALLVPSALHLPPLGPPVLMKLLAFRGQDQADVEALLRDDETRLADVSDYLADRAPDLLIRLGEVLSTARPS